MKKGINLINNLVGVKSKALLCIVLMGFTSLLHANIVENLEGEALNQQGELVYSVPLALPASIHDIQPNLTLRYSQSSPVGNAGLGFSVHLSSGISRCSQQPQYTNIYGGIDDGKTTQYCLDGQPLKRMSNGTLRKYQDDNTKVQLSAGSYAAPLAWTVRDSNGYSYLYELKAAGSRVTERWLLTEKRDVFGNKVSYEYNSQYNIVAIKYPGYRIDISRGEHSGLAPAYVQGKEVAAARLIESIDVSRENGDNLYSYQFSYETAQAYKGVSGYRLAELTKCYGRLDCTRPLKFSYKSFSQPSSGGLEVADLTLLDDSSIDALHFSNDKDYGPLAATLTVSTVELNGEAGDELCFYTRHDTLACVSPSNPGEVKELASGFGYTADKTDDFRQLNFIDLDGDASSDLCILSSDTVKCALYSKERQRFDAPSEWLADVDSDNFYQFTDVNRDGKSDLCIAGRNKDEVGCYASTGSRFSNRVSTVAGDFNTVGRLHYVSGSTGGGPNGSGDRENTYSSKSYRKLPGLIADVNGDAVADVCSIDRDGKLSCQLMRYTGGRTPIGSNQFLVSEAPLYQPSDKENDRKKTAKRKRRYNNDVTQSLRFVDINSDGLLDYCFFADAKYQCSFNAEDRFLSPITMLELEGKDEYLDVVIASSQFVDINSDGYPDFCSKFAGSQHCAYNQGKRFSGFEKRLAWVEGVSVYKASEEVFTSWLRARFDESTKFSSMTALGVASNPVLMGDITGDNKPDFCARTIGGLECFSVEQSQPQGLLAAVETPFGAITRFNYVAPSSPINQDSEAPTPAYLLASMEVDSGIDDLSDQPIFRTVEFRYKGHTVDPVSGQMAFREIARIEADSQRETRSEFYTSGLMLGMDKSISTYVAGTLLQRVDHDLAAQQKNGLYRIETRGKRSREYDPATGGLVSDTTSSFSQIDEYGFPQKTVETKQVGSQVLTVTTQATYWHNESKWLLGKPKSVKVEHHLTNEAVVERTTTYDYNANGSLRQEVIEPDSPMKQTVTYQYFPNGTLKSKATKGLVTDNHSQTRTTRYQYDSIGRVTHSTNSLGMTERFEYGRCGVEKQYNAAGKLALTTKYSSSCRKEREKSMDGSWASYQHIWNRTRNQTPASAREVSHAVVEVVQTSADGQRSITYLDRLGREVRSRQRLARSGRSAITTDVLSYKQFDRMGRLSAVSSPIKESNGSSGLSHWSYTHYDQYGRIERSLSPVGNGQQREVFFEYDRSTTRQWYANYEKRTESNVLGEVARVEEDGKTLVKNYYSDGSLKQTMMQGQEISYLEYDARGNKTYMRDTASGEWHYRYNAFGELYWQKDAEGNITRITYDEGGRKVAEQRTEGSSFWSYHTSGSAIGKLSRAQSPEATREYDYDHLGRLTEETLLIDGHTFRTGYRYDAIGRQSQIRYNQNGAMETPITLGYNAAGPLQTVSAPAGSIELFDMEQVIEDYDSMLAELATLDKLIQSTLRRIEQHEKQSLYFQELGHVFSQKNGKASAVAGQIFAQSKRHADEAAKNRKLYEDFIEKSQKYVGDAAKHKYRYEGLSDDGLNHVFSFEYCAKKVDRVLYERCGRTAWQKFTVSLAEMNAYGDLETTKKTCSADIDPKIYHAKRGWINDPELTRGKQVGYKWERNERGQRVKVPRYEWCRTREVTFSPVAVFERIAEHYQKLADEHNRKAIAGGSDAETVATSVKWDSLKQLWLAPNGRYYKPGDEKPQETQKILYVTGPGGLPIILPNKRKGIVCDNFRCRANYQYAHYEAIPNLQEVVDHYTVQAQHYRSLAKDELSKAANLGDSVADTLEKKAALEEIIEAFKVNVTILGEENLLKNTSDEQRQLVEKNEPLVIWKALDWSASGQLQSELFGNGTVSRREFDPESGALLSAKTTAPGNKVLSDTSYEYDIRGQLVRAFDSAEMDESLYDYEQGQLVSWSRRSMPVNEYERYSYDEFGNITNGSDSFSDASNPFRDTSVIQDNKGFVTQEGRRHYEWTSFGKARRVSQFGQSMTFAYDASLKRVKRVNAEGTLYYVAPGYEVLVGSNGEKEHRIHIRNGYETVATWKRIERQDLQRSNYEKAMQTSKLGETEFASFYHRDHQGTGTIITGSKAELLETRYYSPYGRVLIPKYSKPMSQPLPPVGQQASMEHWLKERPGFKETYKVMSSANNISNFKEKVASVERDWSDEENIKLLANVLTINSVTSSLRGYTGHEQLDFGLVHMNARLYDPVNKRFMTPDSVIPDANKPLAYNRYAYVYNNPVNYTDPSGHEPFAILAAVAYYVTAHVYSDSQFHHTLSSVMLAMTTAPGGNIGSSMVHAAGLSLGTSFAQSGRIGGQELRGAMFASISAGLTHGIGDIKSLHWGEKVLAHGAVQGAIGWARGGSFASNFVAGASGHLAGVAMQGLGIAQGAGAGYKAGRTAIAAVFGGLAAEATGGSFARGAAVAAVVHLYNFEDHMTEDESSGGNYSTSAGEIVSLSKNEFGGFQDDEGNYYALNTDGTAIALDRGSVNSVCPECYVLGGGRAIVAGGYKVIAFFTGKASPTYANFALGSHARNWWKVATFGKAIRLRAKPPSFYWNKAGGDFYQATRSLGHSNPVWNSRFIPLLPLGSSDGMLVND